MKPNNLKRVQWPKTKVLKNINFIYKSIEVKQKKVGRKCWIYK